MPTRLTPCRLNQSLAVSKGIFMKKITMILFLFLLPSCVTQKPPTFPGSQAVGLSGEQGEALVAALKKPGYGLLYGKNYFFALSAPQGWTIDNSAGKKIGLDAVFYLKGSSWENSQSVMYPQIWQKEGKKLDELIAEDIATYKSDFPNLIVTEMPEIILKQNKKVTVKHFMGGAKNGYEAIAYFDEPKVVIMVVLQANDKDSFEKAYKSFLDLLSSYSYLGESSPFENS
jgi:hypothetical protein